MIGQIGCLDSISLGPYIYLCHIKSAVGGLDPDPVEAGNMLCHPERSRRVWSSLWPRTGAGGALWKPKPCTSPRQTGAGTPEGGL